MSIDDDRHARVTRAGRVAIDALNAAMWSSKDADRLFRIVRPADFGPGDDTIAAAIVDLRRSGVDWSDPAPVLDNLRRYQDLWKERVDSGKFGGQPVEIPIEDVLDPDRTPLRFAGRALQTLRAYDVMRHLPRIDVDTAARQVAAHRRHEVAAATMQTVHDILTDPPQGSTRAERQEAIGKVVRDYRELMVARHLYPRRAEHGSPQQRGQPGMSR
jgi:hypothetical protein